MLNDAIEGADQRGGAFPAPATVGRACREQSHSYVAGAKL